MEPSGKTGRLVARALRQHAGAGALVTFALGCGALGILIAAGVVQC